MSDSPKAKRTGRPAVGTVIRIKRGPNAGLLQGIVVLVDGTKQRLPPFPPGTSEAYARERTLAKQEQVRAAGVKKPGAAGVPPKGGGAEWWEKYLAYRDGKGHVPVRWILNQHITPVLGDKHPKDWTRADCEAVVTAIDAKIAAASVSWKTGANAWSLFTKACKVASSAKSATGLRVRSDNPCVGVERPDRGAHKGKQWLYPAEVAQLLACEKVPLRWRRLYALLAYTYVRPSELKALTWGDVDLVAGTIHVTKAWDRARARIKAPKSAAGVRYVPIEAALLPLLTALREGQEATGGVCRMPPIESWSVTFRKHLQRALVTRPALFEDSATQKRIRLYDLRATGLTWRALRQDYAPAIHEAAGHEDFDTTLEYVRAAQLFVGRVGDPFPALPAALLAPTFDHEFGSTRIQVFGIIASPTGFEPVLQP